MAREEPGRLRHRIAAVPRHSRACPAGRGRPTVRAAPPSRVITSPGRRSATGPADTPAGRTSTTQAPSSSSAEKCTSTGTPARFPSTAAARVAEVLTTTRSPGARNSPSWLNRAWATPLGGRDEQPDAVPGGRRLGGLQALRQDEVERHHALRGSPRGRRRGPGHSAGASRSAGAARAPRPPARDGRRCPRRGTRPGASRCACHRGRPSRRPARLLSGEHRGQLVERRLR